MSKTQTERWGPLWCRYQDPDRPLKQLALDGGGIRGLITPGIFGGRAISEKTMCGGTARRVTARVAPSR